MKLVYKLSGNEVRVGDLVEVDGEESRITYIRPTSSDKVSIEGIGAGLSGEYDVSVIRAEWIK
jgi:hypothetical protein